MVNFCNELFSTDQSDITCVSGHYVKLMFAKKKKKILA